jgi:hypothetical protein
MPRSTPDVVKPLTSSSWWREQVTRGQSLSESWSWSSPSPIPTPAFTPRRCRAAGPGPLAVPNRTKKRHGLRHSGLPALGGGHEAARARRPTIVLSLPLQPGSNWRGSGGGADASSAGAASYTRSWGAAPTGALEELLLGRVLEVTPSRP